MRSLSLACPNANTPSSFLGLTGSGLTGASSAIDGGTLGALLFFSKAVGGRESEAVEESIGVACDDETTAGTDVLLGRPNGTGEAFFATSTSGPGLASLGTTDLGGIGFDFGGGDLVGAPLAHSAVTAVT